MKCYCNTDVFRYETLENAGDSYNKVLVCKCGISLIEGKKKIRCKFYNKTILKTGIIIPHKKIIHTNYDIYGINTETADEKCRKELHSNINLLKIGQIYTSIKTSTYISLIDYNLRQLRYKPFFPDKESIDQLLARLNCKPDDNRYVKNSVVYNNKVKNIPNIIKKNKETRCSLPVFKNYRHPNKVAEEEYSDSSEENDEKSDLEVYDSIDENEDYLEEEAFSD